MQPLLVHLIFHPCSSEARSLALDLHRRLDDPAIPGLRVPIVFAPIDGSDWPPLDLELDEAERNFLVLLADNAMTDDLREPPEGRSTWPAFAGDLFDLCKGHAQRWFMPVQLSADAWPLDRRLEQISFQRAHLHPAGSSRAAWLTRNVVIQLYQALAGEQPGTNKRAPVKLFISHAKHDFTGRDSTVGELLAHLELTQPVKAWVDSAEISAGCDFGEEIEAGVTSSSVLAVVTDHYSSRSWCRREVLLAKRKQRPLVVVDAFATHNLRAFPYLGNTPTRRWTSGEAEQCIDLVLKESLRVELNALGLRRHAKPDDQVLFSHPELATLVGLSPDRPVLYPDPPLGDEEIELLAPMKLDLSTPLQRVARNRHLKGVSIALSAGTSFDLERAGLIAEHLQQAMLELCRQLLIRGANLAYGGHLDAGGYTAALLDLALAHRTHSELPPIERIRCYLAWARAPESPTAKTAIAQHHLDAKWVPVPRPRGVEDLDPTRFVEKLIEPLEPKSANDRYAIARSMTLMRERQTADIDARVVLGGKLGGEREGSWYHGHMPGILEEVLLTVKAGKPTFVVGAFGGAAGMIADIFDGNQREEMTWDYHSRAPHILPMRQLYEQRDGGFLDYSEIRTFLREHGWAGLNNGLTEAENRELSRTRDLDRIVGLVIQGLATQKSNP